MTKTLIFGGAFDPPHKEHVSVCKSAMRALGAEKLIIVPTYMPPHKNAGFLSFDERCNLLQLAFDGMNFEIDCIEKERATENYSYKILPILKEKYGDIIYLVGGDSIQYFDTWRKPEEIVKVCPIAVVARDGYGDVRKKTEFLKNTFGGEFIVLDCQGSDVSSSMIKTRLLLGENVEELPSSVMSAIKEEKLFDEFRPFIERLKGYQTDELFEHSIAVVKRAIDFNSKHNLKQDFKKVFLAALLHDNAKQRPSLDGLCVPEDSIGTPVLHQFLGAEKARRDFGIEDEDILDAIRYHTTAKAEMSLLEKLIYTADSLSDDRGYDPIPALRKIAIEDFEKGFLATLKYTVEKLCLRGGSIYPLTLDAYRYYIDSRGVTSAMR